MKVEAFSLWAPCVETLEDWRAFVAGKKAIEDSSAAPKLDFASPLQTRRLSQLTRMTAFMFHKLMEGADALFFSSIRGEIAVQYAIDVAYAKEGELKPATFAISVFNTAPAQATILAKSKVPYTPIFSGERDAIKNLLLAGTASLAAGRTARNVLIYAEERIPDAYRGNLTLRETLPVCIGIRVSGEGDEPMPDDALETPESLIAHLVGCKSELWA